MDSAFALLTRVRDEPVLATFTVGDISTAAVAVYAAYVLLSLLLRILSSIYSSLTRRRLSSYGQWAVVTGATDGIGKAYAKSLARAGLNIVLISRSSDKLASTVAELTSAAPAASFRTITADFSMSANDAGYASIEAGLQGLDIGILVNNVGMSYPSALYFHELSTHAPGAVNDLINLNIVSVTRMVEIVLPRMVAARRGAIINVGSAAGRVPIGNPLYAAYSGSKAYVDFFSKSLHYEVARFGVHVQCHAPYFVTTKLSKIRATSLTTPSPDGYAAAAVAAIGGDASVVPYWSHAVQDAVLHATPAWLLGIYLNWLHKGIRGAYLRKLEKAKAAAASGDAAAPEASADGPASKGQARRRTTGRE